MIKLPLPLLDSTKSWTRSRIVLFACLIATLVAFTWYTFCNGAVNLLSAQLILVQQDSEGKGELESQVQKESAKLVPLAFMGPWAATIPVSFLSISLKHHLVELILSRCFWVILLWAHGLSDVFVLLQVMRECA